MKTRVGVTFLAVVAAVVALSLLSSRAWQSKPENEAPQAKMEIVVSPDMTVYDIAAANGLTPRALKVPLGLKSPEDLDKTVGDLGLTAKEAQQRIRKATVLSAEESSKNWFKIPLKFGLWLVFLTTVFIQLRRGRINAARRKWLLATSVLVFGVVLGSDPSPMGTVKDAIVLWGREHVVFPPRLVALTVFLVSVFLANKFICSWGCQFGTLQDLVFRINRNSTDTAARTRQWKLAFAFTNSVRVAFFLALCVAAIGWATDIVAPIDPFRIFSPGRLGVVGGVFAVILLVASLFVYRPWCHMFCPFGLVGWVVEKISLNRIRVSRETCVSCGSCASACPSTVMGAILKQDRVVPDCFSCGTCQEVCPTKSISFSRGRRF